MALNNQIQLIAYPNRIGNNLADLYTAMDEHFDGAVGVCTFCRCTPRTPTAASRR